MRNFNQTSQSNRIGTKIQINSVLAMNNHLRFNTINNTFKTISNIKQINTQTGSLRNNKALATIPNNKV